MKKSKESKFKTTNFKSAVKSNVEKQRREESGNSYLKIPRGMELFKPKEGKVSVDIIPYVVNMDKHPDADGNGIAEKGSLWYRLPFKIHRNIGSGNEYAICPTSFGKPCPICEYRSKRIQEGAEKEELDALRAGKRNLYFVIPKTKGFEAVPHIWDMSDYLFQQLLNTEIEENEDYGVFPSLEEGLTLKIRFEENSLGKNKYLSANRIDFEERDEAYDESILEELPSLDDVVIVPTYAELKAKFFEIEDEKQDDDDEDDEPKKKPSRKKKTIEEDEDDDEQESTHKRHKLKQVEEDDEEDEDDDEPTPPKKKTVSKPAPKKKVVEEEDDDDDDDEDEDDAPPPPKKKKPVVVEEEDDDDEDDDEPTPPKKKVVEKEKPKEKGKSKKCPYGHKFGTDCDEHDECDDCDLWDECSDAN